MHRLNRAGRVLLEGLLVGLAGLLFALGANLVSPRGLALGRDYFPGATRPSGHSLPGSNTVASLTATSLDLSNALAQATARLREKGLQLAAGERVVELYRDPGYAQQRIVFIDARDDRHYQEGHIPGAYQFDHYRAENYLAAVLPVCLAADIVVVYCNGGDCEDSEFAALTLRDAAVPPDKLWVYAGGMTEWVRNGLPVEVGERGSGQLREAKP